MKGWRGLLMLCAALYFLGGCAVYTPRDIQGVEDLINQAAAAGAEK